MHVHVIARNPGLGQCHRGSGVSGDAGLARVAAWAATLDHVSDGVWHIKSSVTARLPGCAGSALAALMMPQEPCEALRSFPRQWEAVQVLMRAWVSWSGQAQNDPSSVARRSVT